MLRLLRKLELPHAFGSLFFPHTCPGCGVALISSQESVCPGCIARFPETYFASMPDNAVERLFWGRVDIMAASSRYYYTGRSALQSALHALKYKGNRKAGLLLGRLLAASLIASGRFERIEAIVPMPLHRDKQRHRGYNQSEIIARGISQAIGAPVLSKSIIRRRYTTTQTRLSRIQRWSNVADGFVVTKPESLSGKRLLVVDDVATTGASLEACISCLTAAVNAEIFVATVAFSER